MIFLKVNYSNKLSKEKGVICFIVTHIFCFLGRKDDICATGSVYSVIMFNSLQMGQSGILRTYDILKVHFSRNVKAKRQWIKLLIRIPSV